MKARVPARVLTLALLMLIVPLLAACGADDSPAPTATTAPATSATSTGEATPTTAEEEASTSTPETSASSEPLIIGVSGSSHYDSLNWFLRRQPSYSYTVPNLMFLGLVKIEPWNDFQAVPALAESIDVSDDGLTYTAHIREGLLWPDGEQFTADDVVFTVEMVLNPDYAANSAVEFTMLDSVEALDDLTVEFTLSTPNVLFINSLALDIAPKHILEDQDPIAGEFATSNGFGMGPYMISDWRRDESMTFVANPNYYLGEPEIKTVILRQFADEAGVLAALRTNEIHVAEIDPRWQTELDPNVYDISTSYGASPNSIAFNFMADIWADPVPRQALNYAINRAATIEGLLLGAGTPASGTIPNSAWEDPTLEPYTYDHDKVAELMTSAGWEKNGDGFWEKDGETFAFNLFAPGFIVSAAQLWLDDLVAAGFDVTLDTIRDYSWIFSNLDQAHAITWNFGTPVDPDSTFLALHSSAWPENGGFNLYYSNEEVDAGLDAGRATADREVRQTAYNDMQAAVREYPPYLFGFTENALVAIDKRVGGWIDGLGTHSSGVMALTTNIADWTLGE